MKTTFQQSKSLKEIGFNLPVHYYYKEHKDGKVSELLVSPASDINSENKTMYSAPSVSEALQWIRDSNKEIRCGVYPISLRYTYVIRFIGQNRTTAPFLSDGISFPSYHEADSALLDALLEYLETKKT